MSTLVWNIFVSHTWFSLFTWYYLFTKLLKVWITELQHQQKWNIQMRVHDIIFACSQRLKQQVFGCYHNSADNITLTVSMSFGWHTAQFISAIGTVHVVVAELTGNETQVFIVTWTPIYLIAGGCSFRYRNRWKYPIKLKTFASKYPTLTTWIKLNLNTTMIHFKQSFKLQDEQFPASGYSNK